MKRFLFAALTLGMAGAAAAQDFSSSIAVETVEAHRVVLRGTDVERREDGGAYVHGWAQRARGQAGLINAHLHVEAFDGQGTSLGVAEGGWNGALSMRDRSAESFHIRMPAEMASRAARVRVSVEQGARHD